MDEPVHGRLAAVYAAPAKRLPKSFYFAAGIAALIHAGLGWYLINQTFSVSPVEVIHEGPSILVDNVRLKPVKPETTKPKPVVPVHKTTVIDTTKTDTIPVTPQDKGQTDTPTTVLPKTDQPPPPPVTTDKPEKPSVIVARWAKFPDADALASYYPPRATEDEVEGSATVQCIVLDTSGRVSCAVVDESPARYGFGNATARMVQDKGRVDTSQGNIAVGAILRQTVTWRLN